MKIGAFALVTCVLLPLAVLGEVDRMLTVKSVQVKYETLLKYLEEGFEVHGSESIVEYYESIINRFESTIEKPIGEFSDAGVRHVHYGLRMLSGLDGGDYSGEDVSIVLGTPLFMFWDPSMLMNSTNQGVYYDFVLSYLEKINTSTATDLLSNYDCFKILDLGLDILPHNDVDYDNKILSGLVGLSRQARFIGLIREAKISECKAGRDATLAGACELEVDNALEPLRNVKFRYKEVLAKNPLLMKNRLRCFIELIRDDVSGLKEGSNNELKSWYLKTQELVQSSESEKICNEHQFFSEYEAVLGSSFDELDLDSFESRIGRYALIVDAFFRRE